MLPHLFTQMACSDHSNSLNVITLASTFFI